MKPSQINWVPLKNASKNTEHMSRILNKLEIRNPLKSHSLKTGIRKYLSIENNH